MARALQCVLILMLAPCLAGHEVITTKLTWTAEISRIFEKRCISCHRKGGPSPMALTSYADVRPWAVAIREEVLERRMPPWSAVKGFGDFKDDGGLSGNEMLRIAEWVTGGAPEGDPVHLKPFRSATSGGPALPAYETRTAGDGTVLSRPLDLIAIRPFEVPDGASVKITAHFADGRIEPLLWILDYRSKWNRTYRYLDPIKLHKGTRIQVSPAIATFRLVSRPAKAW